jgi:hypothetical protein
MLPVFGIEMCSDAVLLYDAKLKLRLISLETTRASHTFTHRLELPHHPLHDILRGLLILPPPRDFKQELVECHAVGDVLLVQVLEGRQVVVEV